ncbi:hypothetical protein ACFY1P_33215 [Streptomyces sp. NPDC001407]|uniref:hypothetical protein n=1 Tax=Streptomyces sp. NPDC001407 TaxID=3364573 RepID=UPI0036A05367
MTLILDQLREWQGTDGPAEWQAAWDRARALLHPIWEGRDMTWDGVILADGGAALATALYIIARETNANPSQITRDQVEELKQRQPGETDGDIPPRWESRLRALGHDLDDTADPVVVRWRALRVDNSPPIDAPDAVYEDSTHRWGPAFLEGIRYTLAPIWRDRLQF